MGARHIVVIGGGFAGLNVVRRLARANVRITLVDKMNHHLFQPLLYQVASAALSPADIATSLREILRDQENVTVIMGDVARVEKRAKKLLFTCGMELDYDTLVIAVGARHSYFGNEGWEEHAPGLKTIRDALTIRERILLSFERAERSSDQAAIDALLRFVIIGGGPTGVEMAGAIAEIAHQTMFRNFRNIDPERSRITLIEGSDRLLPAFPPRLSRRAQRDLERLGVEVAVGQIVTDVTSGGVSIGEEFIPSHNIIWAAGNQASPLLASLDVPLDRQGRVIVERDLTIPGDESIFVIGDAAHFRDKKGVPLPAIAPAAIQQGAHVAKSIAKRRRPFTYLDKGSIATIGKHKAVGYIRKFTFSGALAWLFWGFIHVFYLVGYRNRLSVMVNWVFHYLTGLRGARLIQRPIDAEKRPQREP